MRSFHVADGRSDEASHVVHRMLARIAEKHCSYVFRASRSQNLWLIYASPELLAEMPTATLHAVIRSAADWLVGRHDGLSESASIYAAVVIVVEGNRGLVSQSRSQLLHRDVLLAQGLLSAAFNHEVLQQLTGLQSEIELFVIRRIIRELDDRFLSDASQNTTSACSHVESVEVNPLHQDRDGVECTESYVQESHSVGKGGTSTVYLVANPVRIH